jgi:hypothetical protein
MSARLVFALDGHFFFALLLHPCSHQLHLLLLLRTNLFCVHSERSLIAMFQTCMIAVFHYFTFVGSCGKVAPTTMNFN